MLAGGNDFGDKKRMTVFLPGLGVLQSVMPWSDLHFLHREAAGLMDESVFESEGLKQATGDQVSADAATLMHSGVRARVRAAMKR